MKSISSNNTNNEKLVIPSFDKLVKEKNVVGTFLRLYH